MAGKLLTGQIAEAGVAIPGGVLLQALEVEGLQSDAGLFALERAGRCNLAAGGSAGGVWVPRKPRLQGVVGEALDFGPIDPRRPCPEDGCPDGADADG